MSTNPCFSCIIYFISLANIAQGVVLTIGGTKSLTSSSDHLKNSINLIVGLVSLLGGLFLLTGAVKNRPKYVFIYLVVTTPAIIVHTIVVVVTIFREDLESPVLVANIFLSVLAYAMQLAVYLYYRQFADGQEGERVVYTPNNEAAVQQLDDTRV